MAAYAAVVSLMNTVELIQNHPRLSVSLDKKQIESLCEKVGFLEEFLEKYSHDGSSEIEALESQIASLAHVTEDVMESHIVDQIHAGSVSLLDLQKVIEEITTVKKKVMKVVFFKNIMKVVNARKRLEEPQSTFSVLATSSTPLITTDEKRKMVGCEEELIQLMDVLTGQHSSRQIIPIVGMGGIGKTTLTKNAYENPLIVHHFDIREWITISQEYNVKQILLQLLSCQGRPTNEINDETEQKLALQLYQLLSGRRYLIILDDVWSLEAWDKMKFFFPDNGNGSRIVITTRESNVANHFGSLCLAKRFLDGNKSWDLFCEKVFAEEDCPSELEEVGRLIVEKCRGLPLSIVVIGGFLRRSSWTQETWENVENDINSVLISGEDNQCFNILSLSYNHLPAQLKPCFLYMGVFPEDHEISVSRLIKVWVAEGFLKPNKAQSLEEVAEYCFKDLVGRNLILVHSLGSNGRPKTCYIHDVLRDLCLRIAVEEKFLCEVKVKNIPQGTEGERRFALRDSSHKYEDKEEKGEYNHVLASLLMCEKSLTRSLTVKVLQSYRYVYDGYLMSPKFKLLRVLNVVDDSDVASIFHHLNLRYFACNHHFISNMGFLFSIPLLWNVQTLIFTEMIPDPIVDIWGMPQLRHLEIDRIRLHDPNDKQDAIVLQNLRTLKTVLNFKVSEEVCNRMPNLKKLNLAYKDDSSARSSSLCHLSLLHKLESLKLLFYTEYSDLLQNLKFPDSLKKLSLKGCSLKWEDLTTIGSLPNLEVLKLGNWSVKGPEWSPVEGEFQRLKFLKIEWCKNLKYWNADKSHFPVLENLVLERLSELDEIPLGIGEISTLEVIDLNCCSESVAMSTVRILEEQESFGNEDVRVRVTFRTKAELERFREKLVEQELESFTISSNLLLQAKN